MNTWRIVAELYPAPLVRPQAFVVVGDNKSVNIGHGAKCRFLLRAGDVREL
jgi:hypothetical protein